MSLLPVAVTIMSAFPMTVSNFFTSKPNTSIVNFNSHLLEFFHDSLAFLLFQTEDKPFPFKENDDASNEDEGEVIEGELDTDTSEETEEVKE